MPILPDLLRKDLKLVFCGTAAGHKSARQSAYYAGPGNRFWHAIHEVGLTPRLLQPAEYAELLNWRIGLTDICKAAVGNDNTLLRSDFDATHLQTVVSVYQPGVIAFTSKRAAQEFLGAPVRYGLLPQLIESTMLFVLPSPSGAARRYWSLAPWQDLARLANERR